MLKYKLNNYGIGPDDHLYPRGSLHPRQEIDDAAQEYAHDHAHVELYIVRHEGLEIDHHAYGRRPQTASKQISGLDLGELWDNDPFETGLDVDTILSESVKLIRLNYQPLTRDDPEISSVIARLKPQRAPPVLRP